MHYKKKIFLVCLLFYVESFLYAEFNTINTSKAYLRVGPGKWYPIKWVLKIPGLPLKVIEENSGYKMVELYDGTKGWVSSNLISNKNNLLVIEDTNILNNKNKPIAKVKKYVVLTSLGCFKDKESSYCKVRKKNIKGRIDSTKVWGKTF